MYVAKYVRMRRRDEIHRAKMGCAPTQTQLQRTGSPDQTEEEVVQEEHHSDHSLHVVEEEEVNSERGEQQKQKEAGQNGGRR